MPGHRPNPSRDNEGQIRLLVEQFLRDNGWKIRKKPSEQNVRPDLVAERRGERLLFEIKRASEGRRDRVIPLLSQAALEAAHYSRNLAGHPIPVAIVGSNYIPDSVADEAKQFVRERAPDVAVGLVDLEGLRSFAGYGLESVNSERRKDSGILSPKLRARAPQLFSDLNQWMLKVLLAPRISEEYLSAPRGQYQGASQLAGAASVSVMSAFRFVDQLSKEGFLDQRSRRLRIVRSNELLKRWQAASQQRVLEIPMRWILNKGKEALPNALRSFLSAEAIPSDGKRKQNRVLLSPRPQACLGLFAAAEALGLGFVHGVQPYLYLERMSQDIVESLGLSAKGADQQVDIYIRIPGNRESVFRGAVVKEGLPSCDILQVWLDVSQHLSRGKEQADFIWRRVLAPVFEANEE
jgi:hypothetical protein